MNLVPYYRRHLEEWFRSGYNPTDHTARGIEESDMIDRMLSHLESLDEEQRDHLLDVGWTSVYQSTLRTLV